MRYPVDVTINTEVLSFCYCPLYLSISSKNIVKNYYTATLKKTHCFEIAQTQLPIIAMMGQPITLHNIIYILVIEYRNGQICSHF